MVRAGPESGVVLTEGDGDIPGPVQFSHAPVPSGVVAEMVRAGLVGGQADDAVHDLLAGAYAVEAAGVAAGFCRKALLLWQA